MNHCRMKLRKENISNKISLIAQYIFFKQQIEGFLSNRSLLLLRSSPEKDVSNLTNNFRKDFNNVSDCSQNCQYTKINQRSRNIPVYALNTLFSAKQQQKQSNLQVYRHKITLTSSWYEHDSIQMFNHEEEKQVGGETDQRVRTNCLCL